VQSGWRKPRLVVALVITAAVLVMLRPTPSGLTHDFVNPGDPSLYVWTMSWAGHALVHHPTHILDGPIFWPHHTTLAYSDTLFPLVAPYEVLHTLTGSWEAAINLLTLLLIAGNVTATYFLAHRLVGRRDAALVAAFGFGFSGYVLAHLSHLNLLSLGLFPLGFLVLFRLLERPRVGTGLLLGVVSAAMFLVAAYYAVIWAAVVAVVLVLHAMRVRGRLGGGLVRALATTAVSAAVLAGPVAVVYVHLQHDPAFRRGPQAGAGLHPVDLVTPAGNSTVYRHVLSGGQTRNVEHHFFPAFSIAAFAALGAVVAVTGWRRARRDEIWLLVAAGAAALVLAVGDRILGHAAPLAYLRHLPGVDGVREPARFALVTLLAGDVLAALGIAWVLDHIRAAPVRAGAAALAVAMVLVELAAGTHGIRFDDRAPTLAVYRALAHEPPGAVLELPAYDVATIPGVVGEAPRMVYATLDWHPRWNGYTAFIPPGYDDQRAEFDALATDQFALATAVGLRIRYLILHTGAHNGIPQYTPEEVQAMIATLPSYAHARRIGPDWLVDLGPIHVAG